jgi:hypothetical protein
MSAWDLTGPWRTYGSGQKSHFHPQLTPDRRWILFTGGDADSETNHLFLLDVSDLKSLDVVSSQKLSPTGENDLTRTMPPKDRTAGALRVMPIALRGGRPRDGAKITTEGELAAPKPPADVEFAPGVRRFARNGG